MKVRQGFRNWTGFIPAGAFAFAIFMLATSAQARVETLRWDHPDTTRVVGFRIYTSSTLGQYGSTPIEDIAIVESVHRGLGSLGYDQGRYVADDGDNWYSESGLHRFHQQILAALEH